MAAGMLSMALAATLVLTGCAGTSISRFRGARTLGDDSLRATIGLSLAPAAGLSLSDSIFGAGAPFSFPMEGQVSYGITDRIDISAKLWMAFMSPFQWLESNAEGGLGISSQLMIGDTSSGVVGAFHILGSLYGADVSQGIPFAVEVDVGGRTVAAGFGGTVDVVLGADSNGVSRLYSGSTLRFVDDRYRYHRHGITPGSAQSDSLMAVGRSGWQIAPFVGFTRSDRLYFEISGLILPDPFEPGFDWAAFFGVAAKLGR